MDNRQIVAMIVVSVLSKCGLGKQQTKSVRVPIYVQRGCGGASDSFSLERTELTEAARGENASTGHSNCFGKASVLQLVDDDDGVVDSKA